MKKNFLALIAAIIVLTITSCNSLTTIMNTTDMNGVHTICSSDLAFFDEFDIAMGGRIAGNDSLLAFLVTCNKHANHGLFDKTDRMLIRLTNNEEIILDNIYDREFDRETKTNVAQDMVFRNGIAYRYSPFTGNIYVSPYTVHTLVPRVYTTIETKSYALYLVSKKQVHDIIDKGAVKVRVEIENADCDMPHPEKLQAKVAKLYNFLRTVHSQSRTEF